MDRADRCVRRTAFCGDTAERVCTRAVPATSLSEISVHACSTARPEAMLWHRVAESIPLRPFRAQQQGSSSFGFPATSGNPKRWVPCVGRPALPQAPHRDAWGHGIPGALIK